MITCPFCSETLADSKHGYASHIETYHNEKSPYLVKRDLLPINTSKRTTEQIVADFERRNMEHIFDGTKSAKPEFVAKVVKALHPQNCSCNKCFNDRLDAIIKMQEENI